MADRVEVVALNEGELVSRADGSAAREVVLALPLGRLLVRMLRVPAGTEDTEAFLVSAMQELNPYPDEPLTVGWETVRESEGGAVVLAAALPESSADDIAEKLDAKKLRVTRLDLLTLGTLRALWPALAGGGELGKVRRLLLMAAEGAAEMFVLDGDTPTSIRSVPEGSDLRLAAVKCLMEAEDFGGELPLAEVVAVGGADASALTAFAPVRELAAVSLQDSLEAVAAREADQGVLDARPQSWRDYLEETRFKSKLVRSVAVAVGGWLIVMGVLFGVPAVYGYMTDYQKGISKQHSKAYRQVCDMRDKVLLVRKYSDHNRGALEIMKAVSDRLPGDIELDGWDFKRGEGVSFTGTADDPQSVYDLKDELTALADSEGSKVFGRVKLGRLSSAKGNKQKFSLECLHEAEEEE